MIRGSNDQRFPLVFILIITLILRLYNIQAPILGEHSWRQSDTAAIARNFFNNGFNFLYPQVQWGGAEGYCQTEFPIFSFLVAILYKVFGVHDWVGRGLSIFFTLVTIYFLYALTEELISQKVAFWSCFTYAILPINIYYGRAFQPESFHIAMSVISIYYFRLWLLKSKDKFLLISSICLCLATLVKAIPLVYAGIPIMYLAIDKFKLRILQQYKLYIYALIVIAPVLLWGYHSYQVYQMSGLSFGFDINRFGSGERFHDIAVRWEQIFYLLAGKHLVIVGFFLLVFGLSIKRVKSEERLFDLCLIGCLVYYFIFTKLVSVHEYYQLPILIPISVYIGKALVLLFNSAQVWKRRIAIASLVLIIGISFTLYNIVYTSQENPVTSNQYALGQTIKQYTKPEDLIITATGGDPTILYLANRRGWTTLPELAEDAFLKELQKQGAKYFVGSYKVVEFWTTKMNNQQIQKVTSIINNPNHKTILNDQSFFIIQLSIP